MPAYPFLARRRLDADRIARDHARRSAAVGVPYTDEMIAAARADFRAQADPDAGDVDGAAQRAIRKAQARDFDGDPQRVDARSTRWSPTSRCSARWSTSRPSSPTRAGSAMDGTVYDRAPALRRQLGAAAHVARVLRRGRLGLPPGRAQGPGRRRPADLPQRRRPEEGLTPMLWLFVILVLAFLAVVLWVYRPGARRAQRAAATQIFRNEDAPRRTTSAPARPRGRRRHPDRDHRPRVGRHQGARHADAAVVALDALRDHRLGGDLHDPLPGLADGHAGDAGPPRLLEPAAASPPRSPRAGGQRAARRAAVGEDLGDGRSTIPQLLHFATAGGAAIFRNNCSQCHGAGAAGVRRSLSEPARRRLALGRHRRPTSSRP